MKGKSKKKKTPLYQQYGFASEEEFRARYPLADGKKGKTKRRYARLTNINPKARGIN